MMEFCTNNNKASNSFEWAKRSSTKIGTVFSESDSRLMPKKKGKAVTEPITSASSSNTFKILSIAKKWESFDATDDEAESDIASSCQRINLEETGRN
uniref:Uncharacterized protein n=1 Tax=Heterorhabditis bacteriophora TaxID=37862 RepID=A0A1I7XI32_HETBA